MAQRGPLTLIGCLGELINGESGGKEVESYYFKYFMAVDYRPISGQEWRGRKPTKSGGPAYKSLIFKG